METSRYGNAARLLHWLMAVLVLITLPVGVLMTQSAIDRDLQNALFIYHKNVGVCLLVMVMLRLVVRWRHPPPAVPGSLPPWQARAAGTTHRVLYLLLLIVPVAGFVRVQAGGYPIEMLDALGMPFLVPRSDDLAEQAKSVHYWAGLVIMGFIAMHIAAALFHGVVKRDGVFRRMWPPLGGNNRDAP